MLRGINKQVIFEESADRQHFLTVMKECKDVSGFCLHAFCLMSNHVHLLLEIKNEPLDLVIKRIGSRYAVWFNRKYQRVGHLFQDRFRSENVETDQYFMTVLRYILQNPMKAGIESHPGTYRWSSYLAYEKGTGLLTDTQYATELFGGREKLISFIQQDNDDSAMDEENYQWRLQEDEAKAVMNRITDCVSSSQFQQLDPPRKKEYIAQMYLAKLTMSQISRLTGVSKATVHKIISDLDPDSIADRRSLVLRED